MPLLMPPSFMSQVNHTRYFCVDEFIGSSSAIRLQSDEFLSNQNQVTDLQSLSIPQLLPKDGLVYVHQGEFAISNPTDKHIKFLGSSDATTCHVVALRNPVTGCCGLIHVDSLYKESLETIASRIGQGSSSLDLFIVGGYQDENGKSEEISEELIKFFSSESTQTFKLQLCCIGRFNTTTKCTSGRSTKSHPSPIAYGAAIDIRSGKVFRATFPDKGPDEPLRHVKIGFAPRDGYFEYYDSKTGLLTIKAFGFRGRYDPKLLKLWIDVPDSRYLEEMSTSPKVEPPYFCSVSKAALKLVIENLPRMENSSCFPDGKSRIWTLKSGSWIKE